MNPEHGVFLRCASRPVREKAAAPPPSRAAQIKDAKHRRLLAAARAPARVLELREHDGTLQAADEPTKRGPSAPKRAGRRNRPGKTWKVGGEPCPEGHGSVGLAAQNPDSLALALARARALALAHALSHALAIILSNLSTAFSITLIAGPNENLT